MRRTNLPHSLGALSQEGIPGRALRSDRDFQNAVALMGEELVGVDDICELESMSNHRAQVDATGGYDVHQAPHALLSARAKGGHDMVVAKPCCKGIKWNLEALRIDTQA